MWCQKSACHWMAGQCCHLAIHETASFTKITSSIFETCQWGKYIFLKQQQEKKNPKNPQHRFLVFFLPFSLDSVDMTRDCWKVIDGATGRRGGGRGNWGNYIGGLVRGGSGGEKNKQKKKTQRGGLVSSDFRLGTFPHRTRWVWLAIFTLIIETII